MRLAARYQSLIILFALLFLIGCSQILRPAEWEALSNDEKARSTLNDYTKSLGVLQEGVRAYLIVHPERREAWEKVLKPKFTAAYDQITFFVDKGKRGEPVAYKEVETVMNVKIADIASILTTWGYYDQRKTARVGPLKFPLMRIA